MKNLIVFFVIFTLIVTSSIYDNSSNSIAQEMEASSGLTNIGYAPFNLTAERFNCDGFIESLSPLKEIHIAFIYNTFGNNFSCLKRLLADERLKTLEVNLINEPGHRNNRLGSYEFLYGVGTVSDYNNKLIKRDAKLKTKFVNYVAPLQEVLRDNVKSYTSVLINPGLESNLTTKAGRVLIQWARESFPDTRIVWNPYRSSLRTRKVVKADLIEGHGLYPAINAPCVYNMDGTDVQYPNRRALGGTDFKNYYNSGAPLFQNLEKYGNRCEIALVWTQEGNGLSYKEGFKDPRKRNNFISTKMYKQIMRDIIAVHRRGKIAPQSDTYTSSDNAIVKTCSLVLTDFEDGLKYGRLLKQSEFADRGGVLILPKGFESVRSATLVKGNTVVDQFTSYGPYHDGRPFFRSPVSPTKYPFNTYLVFNKGSTRYCYKLPNPRIRLD